MKKLIAFLLAGVMLLSLAACAAKTDDQPAAEEDTIADALTLLNTVWAGYTEDEKFPAAGGDYSEENMTDGAPGRVSLEDPSNVEYLLSIPAAVVEKADDAASLTHMLNSNTFTCGAIRLKDAGEMEAAAKDIKDYIMAKQWMCGFPDKLVVASTGSYLIEVYGAEDLVNTFRDKLQSAYPQTTILSDDPIA